MLKLAPSTEWTMPSRTSNSTCKSFTVTRGSRVFSGMFLLLCLSTIGVHCIPQAVTQHVVCQDGKQDERNHKQVPGRKADRPYRVGVLKQGAPTHCRRH